MERASKSIAFQIVRASVLSASLVWAAAGCSSSAGTPVKDAAADMPAQQNDGSADGSNQDKAPSTDVNSDTPKDMGSTSDTSSRDVATTDGPPADTTSSNDGSTSDTGTSVDGSQAAPPGLVNGRTVPVGASTPIVVNAGAMLPANGATNVPVDTLLRIGF